MERTRILAAVVFVVSCAAEPGELEPDPTPPGEPPPAMTEVVLDGLQPGWLVTTTRFGEQASETTVVSDGGPLRLVGTATDVFAAVVTDATGAVISTHAMNAPCTMAHSRQLHVPGEFATIQAAVDAAAPGDTVKVAAGTYTEAIEMRPGVCLLGSGARRTILDARGASMTLVDLTDAPGSVVSGFTLRGAGIASTSSCIDDPFRCSGDWYRPAMYVSGQDWIDPIQDAPPLIVNNVFTDNVTALMLYWRSVAIVRNNVFVHNRDGLVANHFQSGGLVANNVFYDNRELAIGNQAASLDILQNVIARSAVGIRFEYVQTGAIRCNVFFANGANQRDTHAVPPRFTIGTDGNVEVDPRFVAPDAGDFSLGSGSPGRDPSCAPRHAHEPDGSPHDSGAYGGPLAAWVDL